jgi:WD40 repeat protein
VAAGRAVASVVSPTVALLSAGTVKAMFIRKLQLAAVLAVAIACSGMSLAQVARGLPRADTGGAVEQPAPQEKPKRGADAGARPEADMSKPLRSLPGHTDRVTSVAFSRDGRWIATAAWDGTARLWDAQTGKEMCCLNVPAPRDYHTAHLSRIMFSPDNEFVVIAQRTMPNEPGVIVWNRRTGERVRDFPGLCAAFSPDGKQIACGGYSAIAAPIRLFEFPAGKLIREMRGQQEHVESLTFSPDGSTLYSTGPLPRPDRGDAVERGGLMPHLFRVWDVATGKQRPSSLHGADVLQRHALSPDGRTLAEAGTLVEIATGGGRGQLSGPIHTVCGLAFSPDGRTLATAGEDGTVRLWDLPSGKELACLGKEVDPFKGGWVLSVAFATDGRTLVSGGLDKQAHIWDVSRITTRQQKLAQRSPAELQVDWSNLAGDSVTAYAALGRLVSSPASAVPFLGKQLETIKPVDAKRLERLLADLDSDKFAVREQATGELQALAEHAVPAIRTALAGNPSLESKQRLEALLNRLESASLSAETLRQIRAVEALEFIGNSEALRLLTQLAAGPPQAHLTQEAKASVGRLARQVAPTP